MGVRVRHVATSEEKGDPGHAMKLLQRPRDALPDVNDARGRLGRQIVEIGMVLPRDDLGVTWADRVRVEERYRELVLMDHVRRERAGGDAENTHAVM